MILFLTLFLTFSYMFFFVQQKDLKFECFYISIFVFALKSLLKLMQIIMLVCFYLKKLLLVKTNELIFLKVFHVLQSLTCQFK